MAENSRKNEHFELRRIAIIAILAALLLPALQKSRNSAKLSDCKNTLRSIQLSIDNYETDNDDYT